MDEAVSTGIPQERFGFPKQDGPSLSYWLQGVRSDHLLDHRTTPELPLSADIVIIGSGVSTPSRPTKPPDSWLKAPSNR
jgi:hypothetical protein